MVAGLAMFQLEREVQGNERSMLSGQTKILRLDDTDYYVSEEVYRNHQLLSVGSMVFFFMGFSIMAVSSLIDRFGRVGEDEADPEA